MSRMIDAQLPTQTMLVTGATGNIGGQLISRLADHNGVVVRATTRDATTAVLPAGVEPVQADLRDAESLRSALAGVTSLFLVPGMGADADILSLAARSGVEHVVLVSSITVLTHPHLGPAQQNAEVERLLEASGMSWTILRPTQFASNALWWADSIRTSRTVEVPFPDTGLPTIHPADIAALAHIALTQPGHRGRKYALTGPELITPRRQLATIASALGTPISVVEISRDRARDQMIPAMGKQTADAILDVTGGDTNNELLTVRDTVPRVLGHPARTFQQWVAENASAFR